MGICKRLMDRYTHMVMRLTRLVYNLYYLRGEILLHWLEQARDQIQEKRSFVAYD